MAEWSVGASAAVLLGDKCNGEGNGHPAMCFEGCGQVNGSQPHHKTTCLRLVPLHHT